jgi:hypothetical protein
MADFSTARKAGLAAQVVARQLRDTRTFKATLQGFRATMGHCRRVLHQLWLEVTGFVFLALAGIGAVALGREYIKYQAGNANPGRLAVAVAFTVLFGWFGLTSFWRVRRKR